MLIQSPFVRWTVENRLTRMHGLRPVYFLLTTEGEKVAAAISHSGENNNVMYRPCHRFIHDYGQRLGLDANLEWTSENALAVWLDAVVHNSFVHSSTVGVGCSWYLALITDHHLTGLMELVRRLYPIVQKLNLDEVRIRMGNQKWTIPRNNMSMTYLIFHEFIQELHLESTDFILVAVLGNYDIRVVVIDGIENWEKNYEWIYSFSSSTLRRRCFQMMRGAFGVSWRWKFFRSDCTFLFSSSFLMSSTAVTTRARFRSYSVPEHTTDSFAVISCGVVMFFGFCLNNQNSNWRFLCGASRSAIAYTFRLFW